MSKKAQKNNALRGTYLVVVDDTEEFELALYYAAHVTAAHDMHPAVISIIEKQDFIHWGTIESRMSEEVRKKTEREAWDAVKRIHDITGLISSIYVEEGNKQDVILDVLENDKTIKMLILASSKSSNPGSLVTYFTTKGLSKLPVPVMIIPGGLKPDQIEELV